MGYQSWDVVFDHCEAWKWILVRLEGRLPKGRDSNVKGGICQKAKAGYCPCCTRATHVAIPQPYTLGAVDPLKQMGIRLWSAFGPWAARRLAAIDYSMKYINCYPPPPGWDWAAKALDIQAPEPILRGIPGGGPIVIRTIAQTNNAKVLSQLLPHLKEPMKAKESPNVQPAPKEPLKTSDEKRPDATSSATATPNPVLQVNLSGDSQQQMPPQPSNSDPRWPGRPMSSVQEPQSQLSTSRERRNGTPFRGNLFRQQHRWGLRHRRNRPPASSQDPQQESPAPDSQGSSDRQGWRDWSEWKK